MKLRLKSTSAARSLIREYEPFHAVADRDADGRWTVGYGHRAGAREDTTVTRDDADLLLIYDVLQAERAIDETVTEDLQAPQRDALVAFALGIGLAAFRRSAVVRLINKGRWSAAADAIAAWGGGEIGRHLAERDLFRTDLPADTSSSPVELVIEVEHPDIEDEDPVTVVDAEAIGESEVTENPGAADAPATDTADADVTPETGETCDVNDADDAVEPDAVDDAEETSVEQADVAPEPDEPRETPHPVAARPVRSAIAERVITRMLSQLAIREPEPADERPIADAIPSAADTQTEAAPVNAVEEAAEDTADADAGDETVADASADGPVGYVFAEAAEPVDDDEFELPDAEPAAIESVVDVPETAELPGAPVDALPRVAGSAATGELGQASGLSRAGEPVDGDVDVEISEADDDLPVPEDISPEFEAGAVIPRRNGWTNGDDSPAPQATSFPTGTVSVLGIGVLAFGVGVWDTVSRWDLYYTGEVWPFGPATAAAGFVLTAAASIALVGRNIRKS